MGELTYPPKGIEGQFYHNQGTCILPRGHCKCAYETCINCKYLRPKTWWDEAHKMEPYKEIDYINQEIQKAING